MDKKTALIRRLRVTAALILVVLYVLGLIAMVAFSFQTGLILWVISTLGGIGLLYWIRQVDKRNAPEENPKSDGPEQSSGEDETPCE